MWYICTLEYYSGFPDSSGGKESTCKAGDPGSIPGLGRSTGEGIGYPFQCSWEYYSVLKRRKVLIHATTWMKPKDIMISEINQSKKDKYCTILLI